MNEGTLHAAMPAASPAAELPLEDVLARWNRLVWWVGIRPMFRRMLELNLTLAESVVLRSLQRGPLTVTEVADCLYVSHSAASRAVDRLVQDGFMSRQENPDDRRQKVLTLTKKGEAMVGEVESLFAHRLRPVIDALSGAEQEQLRVLMARMLDARAVGCDEVVAETSCPVLGALAPAGALVNGASSPERGNST